MPRSFAALLDLEIHRSLVRRGLRRPSRPRRRSSSRRPKPPPPTAGAPPPGLFVFRTEDFDPADLVTDYVPVPGACMADMEDGEQPFGPPSPSFAFDDLDQAAPLVLARARAA